MGWLRLQIRSRAASCSALRVRSLGGRCWLTSWSRGSPRGWPLRWLQTRPEARPSRPGLRPQHPRIGGDPL